MRKKSKKTFLEKKRSQCSHKAISLLTISSNVLVRTGLWWSYLSSWTPCERQNSPCSSWHRKEEGRGGERRWGLNLILAEVQPNPQFWGFIQSTYCNEQRALKKTPKTSDFTLSFASSKPHHFVALNGGNLTCVEKFKTVKQALNRLDKLLRGGKKK